MNYILVLFLISLAAISNSIMDKISFHFWKFRFKHLNRQWWDPQVSWKNKYIDKNPKKGFKYLDLKIFKIKYPIFLTDAWHFFQTLMLLFFFLAMIVPDPESITRFNLIEKLLLYGTTYILVFNFFFNNYLED